MWHNMVTICLLVVERQFRGDNDKFEVELNGISIKCHKRQWSSSTVVGALDDRLIDVKAEKFHEIVL